MNFNTDQTLHCPCCDPDATFHNLHLGQVEVAFQHDAITLGWKDEELYILSDRLVTNPECEDTIRIHCSCEGGHLFDVVFWFHGGRLNHSTVEPAKHGEEETRTFQRRR